MVVSQRAVSDPHSISFLRLMHSNHSREEGLHFFEFIPISHPPLQLPWQERKRTCVWPHPYFRRADEQHIFIETSYRMTKGHYQWFLSLILRRRSANRRSADITLILVGRNGPYPITLTLLISGCMVNTFQVHEHLLFGSNLLVLKNEIRNLGSVNECLCTRFFFIFTKDSDRYIQRLHVYEM